MSDDEQSHDKMLELGFPPELDVEDVLDLGFDIDVSDPTGNTDGVLEMGFDIDVSDPARHTYGALEMGFDTNDITLDESLWRWVLIWIRRILTWIDLLLSFDLDPIRFVIQWAVGDLQIAMHQLDMDWVGDAMSPDEAIARQQVLDSTQELLLACQLISISRLAT
ncbi:uncharacterized protein BJ212DRAFT_1480233 [Suillus subaureus]|uniref:Uncharacterized protein n=1 Tax=Suillus subaureus TaxID=48587 RepID=A0A9P7ECY3_9AGAM|nr:uncharacterized protein BJ212DRAFT_1480233 [Suillus subaureus]KAG1817676.1 hypothetical protein BJ212DRAFT_1480233 [Suillus subaureus]